MKGIPIIRISQRELQDKFNRNDGGYPEQMNDLCKVCSYDEPAHPNSGQVPHTRSQIDKFFDGGTLVLGVHYFKRPDGKCDLKHKVAVAATLCFRSSLAVIL